MGVEHVRCFTNAFAPLFSCGIGYAFLFSLPSDANVSPAHAHDNNDDIQRTTVRCIGC